MRPETKATLLSISCSAAGIASWTWIVPHSQTALPHAVFYTVLLVNTYFSIYTLSRLCASAPYQRLIDIVLVVNYFLLATAIGRPVLFESLSASLFALATLKYAFVAIVVRHFVFKRKLAIDALGLGLCITAVVGSCSDYSRETAWLTAAIFLVANVYLLTLRPMYQIDQMVATAHRRVRSRVAYRK
jgi:hypothetical protein